MDETPEELEQIRREAAGIDPNHFRKKRRRLFAVLIGAAAAGAVWVGLELTDSARNPCERLRDHFCKGAAGDQKCKDAESILSDSVDEPNAQMRSMVRDQCNRKIARLKTEEGVSVR